MCIQYTVYSVYSNSQTPLHDPDADCCLSPLTPHLFIVSLSLQLECGNHREKIPTLPPACVISASLTT